MTLPNNEQCAKVIEALDGEPMLTQWEADFISSNRGRKEFSDRQKICIADLMEKYET